MQRYTTLQFFKREAYFDIVIAYNVAPGRFRERTEVKVPLQYIQDGRTGRYISKSFPGYIGAVEKINLLQDVVEQIVADYVAKNDHKPDSEWLRAAFERRQSAEYQDTIVVHHAVGIPAEAVVPSGTSAALYSNAGKTPPLEASGQTRTPYPTHALAAKLVRGLGNTEPAAPDLKRPEASVKVSTNQIGHAPFGDGDLFRFWTEFMDVRKLVRREDATFNELDSLKGILEVFSNRKNRVLNFGSLDQTFFVEFVYFLIHEYEYRANAQTTPLIGLRNETAMRRLRDLKTYVAFCVAENLLSLNIPRMERYILIARRKFGVKKLSDTQNWELALCKEELEFVINLDYYESEYYTCLSPTNRRYIDIFIFMCLQGTAPIDTMNIRRSDIRNGLILKDRSKTDTAFKVEVDPISMVILERNDFSLDFNDTTLNRALKGIFVTVFELFDNRFGHAFEQIYRRPYSLIERQMRKKGRNVVYEVKHRGLFVEAMTGRRTFLTLIAGKSDEIGIKSAMEMAGHTKASTTLGYMHPTTASGDSLIGVERIKNQDPSI